MATNLGQERIQPNRSESAQENAKKKIMQYFNMLTKGCGRDACTNDNCATFKRSRSMPESIPKPNVAAITAIELLRNQVPLCSKESGRSYDLSQSEPSVPSGGPSSHSPSSNGFTSMDFSSSPTSVLGQYGGRGTVGSPPQVVGPAVVRSEIEDMETSSEGRAEEDEDEDEEEQEEYEPLIGTHSMGALASRLFGSESVSISDHSYREHASEMIGSIHSPESGGLARLLSSVSDSSKDVTQSPSAQPPPVEFISLSESDFERLIEEGKSSDPPDYSKLKNNIFNVFSKVESMNHSFLLPQEEKTESSAISIDVESSQRVFTLLDSLEDESVSSTLMNALAYYTKVARSSRYAAAGSNLNHVVAMLHNPLLLNPEHLENTVPFLFYVVAHLSFEQQVRLVEWHSNCSKERLRELVELVQQSIAFTIALSDSDDFDIHSSPPISSAVCVLQMLYFANLCAAKKTTKMRPEGELVAHLRQQQKRKDSLSPYEKMLCHFEVHPGDILNPPLPFELFLNEEMNDRFVIDQDLMARRGPDTAFSFYNYPCCLSPVNKVEELQLDNLITMAQERGSFMLALLTGALPNRYFDLRVDRHNLIQDTLMQLEIYAEDRPNDVRKQLRIHFREEEGLDEGGVQKEFFQLLIAELLKPEYAMFVVDEETGNCWPNGYSYESEREYMLIGMLFGLAIYNNVILDIHFPMVVYYKLLGCTTVFSDLITSHPTLARSLEGMLQYEGDDFEVVFNLTFCVSQKDVFGEMHSHMLKPGGGSLAVTKDNRQEYVDLYTDWLLNRSIETQFNSFKKGFHMVVKGTSLVNLLRPEELEQLVCGLEEWDFEELEDSTHYDNGYSPEHEVVKNFWHVVHEFDEDQKKAFLQFVTGTDRVPLGGLSKLKFTIIKHGDDSDKLPTAHTCFNILLLSPYATKEKLKDRLLKAITHGKGFGML